MTAWLTLVGIGEDGYAGLGKAARRALLGASCIVGAPRQLELLPHWTCVLFHHQIKLPARQPAPRSNSTPTEPYASR